MSQVYCYHQAPIGQLLLVGKENTLTGIYFPKTWTDENIGGYVEKKSNFTLITKQLDEYFSGKRQVFNLLLEMTGTKFQKQVWQELTKIPYGTTSSYGEIAKQINNPKACRAVGMANNKNPIPIIIPCHRVIGKNGSLTGFGGGFDVKQQLLDLERKTVNY
ncbi:MAG: methylated-DNA-[protein]-cysteine S-methyltransferase [Desulforhopalus sp.]|jgi:methylated-DNA-[protein]-cysteine S-methyltransferase